MCFDFWFFLIGIPKRNTSSAEEWKTYVITAGIKSYKLITKKNKKKHDKIVLAAKTKLNTIEAVISRALINSYISHYEFFLVENLMNSKVHEKL